LNFIESSAYLKLFVQEEGSDRLINLIERTEDREKAVSALAPIEVRSAIRRRERLGDISAVHAGEALSTLTAESRRLIEQPVTATVLSRASAVVDQHSVRALDAIQLATALILRETLIGADVLLFICSDIRLLKAAEAEAMATYNPAVP